MKKLEKKDYLYLSIFLIIVAIFIGILSFKGYIFGSNVDWLNQYITIPEYFRMLFYKTGKIIPEFALNLGLGQNIYYFSYYGLLSPLILLSYFLPFIPMYIYIPSISIISLLVSLFMFYKWINNKYNSKIAFLSTAILLLNSTFFYHFHRHLMFVIYMPFMIGALMSVDYYFEKKKTVPLIICTFLMIMTSYYFSVSGIITIGIYTLYKLLKNNNYNRNQLFKIIGYVSLAILMASIILIPTIYALFVGRSSTSNAINYSLIDLFNPKIGYDKTFYFSYYSWGITMIYIITIIWEIINKKKGFYFLAIISSLYILIPLCSYVLNGFMYIDGKCFIPFLPLMILQISEFFKNVENQKVNYHKLISITILVSIFLIFIAITSYSLPLIILDSTLMLISLYLLTKKKKTYIIYISMYLVLIGSLIGTSLNESYAKFTTIKDINNESYYKLTEEIVDNNLYRTTIEDNILSNSNKVYNIDNLKSSIYSSYSNKNYMNFVRNIFQNEVLNRDNTTITEAQNILYDYYIGAKYLITSKDAPIGYTKVTEENGKSLYINDDVLPVGYSSSKIMSLREFNTLSYPETIDALLNYVIVDRSVNDVYKKGNVKNYKSAYEITELNNITYNEENGHYIIETNSDNNVKIKLNTPINNEIFIIKFKMNKQKDGFACSSNITINGITNALSCSNWKYHNNNNTFEYVLSSNNTISELNITFSKGSFDISDIELYTINYNQIKNIKNSVDEIIFDEVKKTNYLTGTINTREDGYVKLTIPYEKRGFKVYIDDNRVDTVKVDDAFLGFAITEGTHKIEIVYHTPFLKTAKIASLVGLVILISIIIYQKFTKQIKRISNKISSFVKENFLKLKTIIKKFTKENKYYIFLFLSLYVLDLALRLFYNHKVGFYFWFMPMPNLFSILWLSFILILVKSLNKTAGKIVYLIFYIFSLVMFLVHAVYFSYFNMFFDYSVMAVAGEGTEYYDTVLLNIKYWVVIVFILSIYLNIKGLKKAEFSKKTNYKKAGIIILSFLIIRFLMPNLYGTKNAEVEWDDWRNSRRIYENFNDNNKSMMVSGMFEYNVRNFYINFIKDNNTLSDAEKEVLDENFKENIPSETNNYTGIFKGKNLILLQLESIDEFLLDKNIMPTFYKLSKNSLNFTNHYSFTSGGGSTFNSEFMVNTGYSSAYNYNQSAYTFSRNTYSYSLPNLFKNLGYTVNAFHMNSKEYYSRGVNYKAFGYDSYNGLKDLDIYHNNEFWLDTELIKNETFANMILNNSQPSVSYIITYSAHMPYKTSKGTCKMLTDEVGLSEFDCLKLQAKETDDLIKLLLEKLKEKNMLDDTVLVIYADHYDYTIEDKEILNKYKETSNNLINHTPFIIYNNGKVVKNIKQVNSQLDILPTVLNLFGIEYNQNNYIGRDILSKNYDPLVFFPDGSWYNGKTYVANGEYQSGQKMKQKVLNKYNLIVKKKMLLNDAVIKSDYFKGKK